jgi:hypothetical protein
MAQYKIKVTGVLEVIAKFIICKKFLTSCMIIKLED